MRGVNVVSGDIPWGSEIRIMKYATGGVNEKALGKRR